MASLKEIRGIDIEVRTSDPENPESGQVWYNTTTELLKGYKQVVGNAWATGGNLNTARNQTASAGTQTAGLAIAGVDNFPGGTTNFITLNHDDVNDAFDFAMRVTMTYFTD